MKKPTALLLALLGSLAAFTARADVSTLESDFLNPPMSVRPYVWWHWLGPNFSKEGITKDLEAMNATGIGGATIFNITSSVNESHAPTGNNPWPDQTYRSPKYWEAIKHAAAEAKRLGMEVGLHNTVGYSTTGGPWIDENRSMQRLIWSTTEVNGGSTFSAQLPVPPLGQDDGWGKTGRKITIFHDIAVFAVPADKKELAVNEVLDLTARMKPSGDFRWEAPAGKWIVYRMGHASTGRAPHPIPDDVIGKSLEADKISLEQTRYHWETVLNPIKQHLGPLLGTSFRHFLIDSYEAGNQNWSPGFREEFKKRKGYDPLPWMATMGRSVRNGGKNAPERTVGSADQTERFEWDYRDIIATLYLENGWEPAAKMIHAVGAKLQHEPYGGPFDTVAGAALADLPMVEYWSGGDGSVNQNVIAAGRAAGRKVIGAEALTGSPVRSKWTETPAFLKTTLDGAYANGVNRMILHHWVHQPFDDRYQPGFGMGWWGTHFNRYQTWFEPGKDFFRYMQRVQAMLQRGETPADHVSVGSAAAGGDAIAMRNFLTDPKVENGQIVLPSGRRYRFIHVPHGGALLPEAVAQIEKLLAQGATVVSPKPNRSPSLAGYPQCDEKVKSLAEKLWGDDKEPVRKIGKGTLFAKDDVKAASAELGIVERSRIVNSSSSKIRVLDRADGDASWFFVANTERHPATCSVAFAVTNKLPELWDAETGTVAPAPLWRMNKGNTEVDLALGEARSVFVVFRKPLPAGNDNLVGIDAPAGWALATSADGKARIESASPVSGTMRFASGKTKPFSLAPAASVPVQGAWQVDFKPALGKPFSAPFPSLVSFDQSDNPDIKYFSGTATYKTTVDVPADLLKDGQCLTLDLGKVHDMATVTVNGKPLGVWWNPPFARDITAALKPGANSIEVAVTNTWHNLLVGDEQYPADFEWGTDRGAVGHTMKGYPDWFVKNQPRPEKNRKAFVVWYYHRKDTPLLPAGLVGPVVLIAKATAPVHP